jgi:hypothetical protein
MKPYGSTVARITSCLETYGPMTRSEICFHIGMDRMNCSAVITRMSKAGAKTPRRIYISGYTHDSEYGRRYPRAIYSVGNLPDAQKPNKQASRRENRKRSDKRRKVHNTMNFVFNLGKPRRLYDL